MKFLNRGFFAFLICSVISVTGYSQNPAVGTLLKIEQFPSSFIDSRTVGIWLPPNYSNSKKYNVLYMHDGQMLFDAASTWNKQEWKVDETSAQLMAEVAVADFIVVAIWNNGQKRWPEYFPQAVYQSFTDEEKEWLAAEIRPHTGEQVAMVAPYSDSYLQFLVTELKPYIDRTFSTRTKPQNTFIAGSSMGGLISMYAFVKYPEVFGGAACLSTHWIGVFQDENNPIPQKFKSYLSEHLPEAGKRKIYFDYGTATLDALYPKHQQDVDAILVAKGYTEKQWKTAAFEGASHSEEAWSARLGEILVWLMKR